MNRFSISKMASYSGLTPFTIRAWEKRYQAFNPGRSEGNTRYYSGQQLKRLLNIVSLLGHRYKPSYLCTLNDQTLQTIIETQELQTEAGTEGYFIAQLVQAGVSFDEQHFSDLLAHSILRFGVRDAYLKVIYPMLTRIGLMWRCDTIDIAQEHFISQLLKQKLLAAVDLQPSPNQQQGSWLMFLPEDEYHELGLLIAHYLVRQSGKRSIYLGANMPVDSLKDAIALIKPTGIFLQKVVNRTTVDNDFLELLVKSARGCPIYIAGLAADLKLKPAWKIRGVQSVEDLETILLS